MSNQIFYSFDKSMYKKEKEIEKEYLEKSRKFLAGRKIDDLSERDRQEYEHIINASIRDPRQKTMFYNTKEAAIKAKKRADLLDGIIADGEPEILTYIPR